MADKKDEKKLFVFPNAAERLERLNGYLPEFFKKYGEDEDLPEGFLKAAKTLVQITTDKKAFSDYLAADKGSDPLKAACEFIGEKTESPEGPARPLQSELINGLIRRWKSNVAKYDVDEARAKPKPEHTENEKMGRAEKTALRRVRKEQLAGSQEGKFILDVLGDLLHRTISVAVFHASRDKRINPRGQEGVIDVQPDELKSIAHDKLVDAVLGYKDNHDGHFKTYLGKTYERLAGDYLRSVSAAKQLPVALHFTDMRFSQQEGEEGFEARQPAPTEEQAEQEVLRSEQLRIINQHLLQLKPEHQEILRAFLTLDGPETPEEVARRVFKVKKERCKQYVQQAKGALKQQIEKGLLEGDTVKEVHLRNFFKSVDVAVDIAEYIKAREGEEPGVLRNLAKALQSVIGDEPVLVTLLRQGMRQTAGQLKKDVAGGTKSKADEEINSILRALKQKSGFQELVTHLQDGKSLEQFEENQALSKQRAIFEAIKAGLPDEIITKMAQKTLGMGDIREVRHLIKQLRAENTSK